MLFSMKLKISLAAALLAGRLFAQAPEYGPVKGTLVIQGGGSAEGTGIDETFINKAGGLGAKIVVVPTAGGNKAQDGSIRVYKEYQVLAPWKKKGLTNVWMLPRTTRRWRIPRSSPRFCATPTPSGSTG